MRTARLLPLLCLALSSTALAAQEARTLRSEPLAEGVLLVASSNLGDPNVLAVVGPDRVLLVDGMYPDAIEPLLAEVRRTSPAPVRDVVLTHWHPDHTMGNAALRAHGATVWAHPNAQRRMREGNRIEYFAADVPAYPAEALADEELAEARTLTVGDHEVRLVPLAPAHTDGDVLVHLPRANVIHMGDLLLGGIYPFAELSSGADVDGLIAALDVALALADENTVIVTGHGPVGRRAELQAGRDLLATVWARVGAAVAEGRSLEEVVALRPAAEYHDRWNTPLIPTDRFVGILYQAAVDAGARVD